MQFIIKCNILAPYCAQWRSQAEVFQEVWLKRHQLISGAATIRPKTDSLVLVCGTCGTPGNNPTSPFELELEPLRRLPMGCNQGMAGERCNCSKRPKFGRISASAENQTYSPVRIYNEIKCYSFANEVVCILTVQNAFYVLKLSLF